MLLWLADVLRAEGLTVVEHRDFRNADGKLVSWQTHDRPGDWTPRFGVVHATAAPRTQSDDTQVRIVRDGRSDLLGPISNACVDRQGRWHVLSAGRCNSTLAGTDGPFEGLGNTYALSTEACNDNISEPWPDVQYRAYVRGWAAWCRRLGWAPGKLVGHKEHTPGRKSDPTFNMDRFRADVAAVLAGGDDMLDADDKKWLLDNLGPRAQWGHPLPSASLDVNTWAAGDWLKRGEVAVRAIRAIANVDQTDEAAIAAAVLAGLDPSAIAAAIPAELAKRVADELAARLAS